jgi:hypothetical protein
MKIVFQICYTGIERECAELAQFLKITIGILVKLVLSALFYCDRQNSVYHNKPGFCQYSVREKKVREKLFIIFEKNNL